MSNSTIQFTIGSMEVWLCFDNRIDLACIFFGDLLSAALSRSVTFVSPKCSFYSSAVFLPQFFTEIISIFVSPPDEQELDTVEEF